MAIILKDGSRTEDPRLDRIIQFDEESRNYGVVRTLTAEQQRKPRSWTWTCNVWLDQDQSSGCGGFSRAHELAARPVVVPNLTNQFARELYWDAQRNDSFPGGEYPGADPHSLGTSVIAVVKVAVSRGYYTGYSWAFGEEQLFLSVGWKGPAVLGIPWYDSMSNPDSKGFIHPEGSVSGGHAILCNGVSVRGGYYRLHNSWSSRWGKGGDCFVTREDMKTLLSQQGEAVVSEGRSLGTV